MHVKFRGFAIGANYVRTSNCAGPLHVHSPYISLVVASFTFEGHKNGHEDSRENVCMFILNVCIIMQVMLTDTLPEYIVMCLLKCFFSCQQCFACA